MPGWTFIDAHPTAGPTFQRPLDAYELVFFCDSLFNGTADNLQLFELSLSNGTRDARLFSEANIVRAWLSTKRRYPLAAATVRGLDDTALRLKGTTSTDSKAESCTAFTSRPHFLIQENDLAILRPREIIFGHVVSAEEAQQQAAAILNGPRPLSEDLLVQLYVFRETDPKRTDIIYLMILMAHFVTDEIANRTLVRCLLDTLARDEGAEPAQIPLEERLAMAVPSMDLEPIHLRSLSPAIRRWRRTVGIVIFQLRMAKRQGGHTLPCRITRSTPYVAARSCVVSTSLTHTATSAVIANCRLHGITFGNAYLPLAQVAMTRVLYRRYLRGEISEEEWLYRKRQPHMSGGPLNLRPYLNKAWFKGGGGGEFVLSIGFFYYQLPFMTLGETVEQHQHLVSDGAPQFSDLLTFDRFLHRAGLVRKQATAFFSHPLFLEILYAASLVNIEHTWSGALGWTKGVETANGHRSQSDRNSTDEALAAMDIPAVWGHGGSSIGNVDLISPTEYPLPPTHPLSPYCSVPHPMKAGYVSPPFTPPSETTSNSTPKIVVESSMVYLHARPAELYLGAASSRGQLRMYVFYDGNVFEEGVVKEWLDEVKGALLWYLGRTHRSSRTEQGCDDGEDGRIGGSKVKL